MHARGGFGIGLRPERRIERRSPGARPRSSSTTWRPGETGCLRAGRYREDVTVSHSGTADQRITIRSQPGQVATIEGRVLVTADQVTLSQLVLDAHLATGGYGQVVEGDDVVFSDNNVTSGATASCFKVGNPGAGRRRSASRSSAAGSTTARRACSLERSDAHRGAAST